MRGDSEFFQSGYAQPGCAVDLHQFHLISRNWWTRQHFRNQSQSAPSGERDGKQSDLDARCTSDNSKKFLIGIDAGATAFEYVEAGLFPLQYLCDRLPNIFHVDRL